MTVIANNGISRHYVRICHVNPIDQWFLTIWFTVIFTYCHTFNSE